MALAIVQQLRDLASVEENRYFIVRDRGCLPGLVAHLSSDNEDVKYLALEAIYFLSCCQGNREALGLLQMAKESGLYMGVKGLLTHSQDKIKSMAAATFNNLKTFSKFVPMEEITCKGQVRSALKEIDGNTPSSVDKKGSSSSSKKNSSQAKTITLFVSGLRTDESRKEVEYALLRVKGVISILIDLPQQKAVIRTMTTAEVLIGAIYSATGMKASTKETSVCKESAPVAISQVVETDDYADESEEDEEDDDEEEEDEEEDEEWAKSAEKVKYAIVKESDVKEQPAQQNRWFSRITKALWG